MAKKESAVTDAYLLLTEAQTQLAVHASAGKAMSPEQCAELRDKVQRGFEGISEVIRQIRVAVQ